MYEVTTTSAPAITSARSAPLRASVSVIVTTFRPGVNRADSAAQFGTTLVGATTRNGALAGSACRAWQISASASSVLPSPMSSARMPPRRCCHKNASQPEPVQLVGTQPGPQGVRRLPAAGPGDPVGLAGLEQSLHLLLPRPGLAADHAERGQLFPQPGLEPADPQRAADDLLQGPGLLDQAGELPQLGLVQAEVGAVGEQQVRLAAAERGEHVGERDLAALDRDRDPEVEPVVVACYLAGGHADAQRIAGLAVVGGLPGDLYRHPGLAGQQRQQFGGEAHGVQAAELGARHQGRVPGQPAEPEAVQHRLLGLRVPVPGITGCLMQLRAHLRVADLVGPLPVDLDVVAVAIRRAQHQGRVRDHRRGEGTVRGDHRGHLPQPRVEPVAELGLSGGGHREPLAGQRHLLQLRGNRLVEPGQAETPAGGIGAPLRLGLVEVDDAMALGADEPDRDNALRPRGRRRGSRGR